MIMDALIEAYVLLKRSSRHEAREAVRAQFGEGAADLRSIYADDPVSAVSEMDKVEGQMFRAPAEVLAQLCYPLPSWARRLRLRARMSGVA
ncbi:MAG TPA: hypothetical protein VMV79_03450 [Alphaproteobacteria bacterium]|nr:hypothetical protein [Alphaproteobacteria bacterium]